MDLSSMSLYMRLNQKLEDVYDQKTLQGFNIIEDFLVATFLAGAWKTTTWEKYSVSAAALRRRFFETMELTARTIVDAVIEEKEKV
jgi:hypothetical protein